VVSSPAVANGMVYVGSYDHLVYAFGSSATEKFAVSFISSGLPSGASWNVKVNDQMQNTTSSAIIFNLSNGVYSFSVDPPSGYEAFPSSGSITVHFARVNQEIEFRKIENIISLMDLSLLLIVLIVLLVFGLIIFIKRR
jgi:hypothetical protein